MLGRNCETQPRQFSFPPSLIVKGTIKDNYTYFVKCYCLKTTLSFSSQNFLLRFNCIMMSGEQKLPKIAYFVKYNDNDNSCNHCRDFSLPESKKKKIRNFTFLYFTRAQLVILFSNAARSFVFG